MSEKILTNTNFDELILKSDKPVLVDFWAPWCGPCKMFLPTLERFANEHEDKIVVGKVNVDEEIDLATKFHVSSIPTLLLFENGEVVGKNIGGLTLSELEAFTKI